MQGPRRPLVATGEHRQLGIRCDHAGGKPRQKLAAGGELPVEVQPEPIVREQPRRGGPVLGRLRVANRLDRITVFGPPLGGDRVQAGHLPGGGPPQLEREHIREQVVVAKPASLRIHRDHERARVLEPGQNPVGTRASRQPVSERSADPLQQRGSQQQLPHFRRLALEHLGQQVLGHRALTAREADRVALGIGVASQRQRH